MHPDDQTRLREAAGIAARFVPGVGPDSVAPLGAGLINHTFRVAAGTNRWVLQRINDRVFPSPQRIMENLDLLSAHLSAVPLGGLRIPRLMTAMEGERWIAGEDGGLWRLMELIEGGRALDRIENSTQAAEAGRVLGTFHLAVADLPTSHLAVTLPGFHVTPGYVSRLFEVLKENGGTCGRTGIREETAFVAARSESADLLERARREGRIPERVIHGDPKLDNVLFDGTGRHALALIDLDTVQPGLVHYDVGDCLRSCCNRDGESTGAAARVSFDLDVCRELLGAYADATRHLLLPEEVDLLYDAARLMPFELGVRFLTDHLEGNRWFRVTEPDGNLTKARVQFALTDDVEQKEAEIRAIIRESFDSRRPALA